MVVSLVAAILAFLWWAPVALFHGALAAVTLLATHELYAIFAVAEHDRVLYALGMIGAAALFVQPLLVPIVIVVLFSVVALKTRNPDRTELELVFVTLFGILYMPLLMGQLLAIRVMDHGREWAATIVVTVFAREISAHFAGKLLPPGRPLNRHINEQKSFIGAAIGATGATIATLVMTRALIPDYPPTRALALGLSLGIACQLGDLSESYLKRVAGSRHSGTLLGPEGGVLDFTDAAAFAIVTARLFLLMMG